MRFRVSPSSFFEPCGHDLRELYTSQGNDSDLHRIPQSYVKGVSASATSLSTAALQSGALVLHWYKILHNYVIRPDRNRVCGPFVPHHIRKAKA